MEVSLCCHVHGSLRWKKEPEVSARDISGFMDGESWVSAQLVLEDTTVCSRVQPGQNMAAGFVSFSWEGGGYLLQGELMSGGPMGYQGN